MEESSRRHNNLATMHYHLVTEHDPPESMAVKGLFSTIGHQGDCLADWYDHALPEDDPPDCMPI